MIIGLATPRAATSVDDALERIDRSLSDAAARGAEIVCFPEAYLPGLRGLDFAVADFDAGQQEAALRTVAGQARAHGVAVVLGMEWTAPGGRQIVSAVIDARGEVVGRQTKNQLAPSEDHLYVPGDCRRIFEIGGLRFGVVICHEGFRYPETVRWAAVRGAQLVFHPHCTGSDRGGERISAWGAPGSPYYEKAMTCRSVENEIYFAGVNYAFRYQGSATCVIDPSGACMAHLPYGEEGVLVQEIDLRAATGLLAARFAPDRLREEGAA